MTLHVSAAKIEEVVGMAIPQLHRVSTVRAGAVVLVGPKHVSFMYISIYRVSVKALARQQRNRAQLHAQDSNSNDCCIVWFHFSSFTTVILEIFTDVK